MITYLKTYDPNYPSVVSCSINVLGNISPKRYGGVVFNNNLVQKLTVETVSNRIFANHKLKSIALGMHHTFLIDSSKSFLAVGRNNYGQLWDNAGDRLTPSTVSFGGYSGQYAVGATEYGSVVVAPGRLHGAGLSTISPSGTLASGMWNNNLYIETGHANGYTTKSLVCGADTVFANLLEVNDTTRVYGFGNNVNDQLTPLTGTTAVGTIYNNSTKYVIASGYTHTVYIDEANNYNLSITGKYASGATPPAMPSYQAAAVAAGKYFTVIVTLNGEAYIHGNISSTPITNTSGKINLNTTNRCISVSAGYEHIVFLMQDGTVKVCGNNTYGQLGIGNNTNQSSPVTVPGISNCIGIECGPYNTAFIHADGSIKTCGLNDYGQLVLGDTINRNTPTLVNDITLYLS